MTNTGMVLSMFSALAVLAVAVIVAAALWTRARSDREQLEPAYRGSAVDRAQNAWLTSDEDPR